MPFSKYTAFLSRKNKKAYGNLRAWRGIGTPIALASGPVDWGRYRDTSAQELAALVEGKWARLPAPTAAEEPTVLRLLDDGAVFRSIE
jgi:hypothetical protein